jgi:hypothetical protein
VASAQRTVNLSTSATTYPPPLSAILRSLRPGHVSRTLSWYVQLARIAVHRHERKWWSGIGACLWVTIRRCRMPPLSDRCPSSCCRSLSLVIFHVQLPPLRPRNRVTQLRPKPCPAPLQPRDRANAQRQSAPRPTSPVNTPSGSSTARMASPKPPGGPATVMRRKAAADRAEKTANQRPSSTRAAGAGGSSSTMLSKSRCSPCCCKGSWEEPILAGNELIQLHRAIH